MLMWLGMLSTITVELFFLSNVFFILVILFFLDFRNMMDIYNLHLKSETRYIYVYLGLVVTRNR
jgi:hypothetical protein